MSRTIKYRVWDNENKSYNDPYSHSYYAMTQDGELDFYCHGDHWRSCDPDVYFIEQYTGLTDKNGKEIYEGDIVKNIEGVNETAVCVWDESNAEFDFRCKDGRCTRDNVKSWLEMYEVVGNIHENKELLDGSN